MKIYKYVTKKDKRGYFSKLLSNHNKNLIKRNIQEINLSYNNKKGTIRGLHYQSGSFKETKIIYVLKGKIFDVEVNLKTLKVKSKILSENQKQFIVLNEDCAHGFQTMKENCTVLYIHSNVYDKRSEMGVRFNDPEIDIKWPQEITLVSERDKSFDLIT